MSMSPLTVTAPQLRPPHRYIAIEGPIGVGKTTLARLLAERWSMRTLFERPQENPFLERFYRDNTRYALPTQLQFALQRAQLSQEVGAALLGGPGLPGQAASAPLITDFITEKTALFARLTLPDDEFELFRGVARRFDTKAVPFSKLFARSESNVPVERP